MLIWSLLTTHTHIHPHTFARGELPAPRAVLRAPRARRLGDLIVSEARERTARSVTVAVAATRHEVLVLRGRLDASFL